jgi:hypothetical protein
MYKILHLPTGQVMRYYTPNGMGHPYPFADKLTKEQVKMLFTESFSSNFNEGSGIAYFQLSDIPTSNRLIPLYHIEVMEVPDV